MASLFTINIVPNTDSEVIPGDASGSQLTSARRREIFMGLAEYFDSLAGGVRQGTVDFQQDTAATTPTYVGPTGSGSVAASGTLTLSSASGTVGGTINGVSITVTASGGDTATATALAAAINASANALVAGIVTASSALGVVTVTAVLKGVQGNTITLAASGTGNTASGARLTGGVNATANAL